jgi:hypothetical protein
MFDFLHFSGRGFPDRAHALADRPDLGRRAIRFAGGQGRLLPVWRMRDRKTRVVFWTLVAFCILLALMIAAAIIGEMLGNVMDFVNTLSLFWGWSKFIHEVVPTALIYDTHALYEFEHAVVSARARPMPFPYPPLLLLLIWPLALLRPLPGMLLWLGVNMALYVWACWHRPWGPKIAVLGLVVPSTLAAVYYGQVSLFVAACIIGGWRLVGRRPILAGVLFGLAAVKPQFGVLIPVALISARQWRSVISATTTVALLTVVSGWAFGWATWERLPFALNDLAQFVAQHPLVPSPYVTVTSALRLVGAGRALTDAVQFITAVSAAIAIWICFRRGVTGLSVAALMVGAFLVTPYAVFYDLPMVSYAVLAVVIERYQSRDAFGTGELLTLILVLLLPVVMLFAPPEMPWGIIVLVSFFVLILSRIAVTTRSTACSGA